METSRPDRAQPGLPHIQGKQSERGAVNLNCWPSLVLSRHVSPGCRSHRRVLPLLVWDPFMWSQWCDPTKSLRCTRVVMMGSMVWRYLTCTKQWEPARRAHLQTDAASRDYVLYYLKPGTPYSRQLNHQRLLDLWLGTHIYQAYLIVCLFDSLFIW